MPIQATTSSPAAGRRQPGPLSSRWPTIVGAGVIVLAALAAWSNSFRAAYVFDDIPAIVDNPTIRHLWPLRPVLSPGADGGTVGGRPVVNLSLALNYAISGTAGWSYHALNLLIHVLAGLTLFGIVRRTLRLGEGPAPVAVAEGSRRPPPAPASTSSGDGAGPGNATVVALAVALLWTVHPLQTESVTYVVQRVESLMGLFYLLTLYCFIRGATAGGNAPGPGRIWFVGSGLACLLGMASKEVMASAPLIVLLYDRTFVTGGFRDAWRRRKRYYLGLGATWLLLAFLIARTQDRGGSAGFHTSVSSWAYALTQCRAIIHYLRLSVWPHPLVFEYGGALVRNPLLVAPQAVVLVLLLAGTAVALWRRTAAGFTGAWFFLILAPSSSVVPVVTQTMAEHRMYLPLAAVVVLAVAGLFRVLGRRSVPLVAALAVGLGWVTARRNLDYRSAFALWSVTARDNPSNPRAHNNLGSLWLRQGNSAEAIRCFDRALQLDPDYASAHYNLGLALADSGRPREAVAQYETALRLQPASADVEINLGAALLKLGEAAAALPHFTAALRLQPASADAENNLGLALVRLGRPQEAIAHYQAALRLQPDVAAIQTNLEIARQAAAPLPPDGAGAHFELAESLRKKGDLPAAEREYREAIRRQPGHGAAHFALGNLLAQSGRLEEAITEYRAALQLAPGELKIRNNLGNALLMSGRVDEAIVEYAEILRQQPDNAAVRRNLEQARALQQTARPGP